MDDILESVQFEEFFKALNVSMIRSAASKAMWENPSAKMLIAQMLGMDALQDGSNRWREENPEEALANLEKARTKAAAACVQWHLEHSEESRATMKEARALALQWRKENPEKYCAQMEKAWAAARRWAEEHPEEARVYWNKAVEAASKWHREHPEESLTIKKKAWAATAKWRKEHPEEFRANSLKGSAAAGKYWKEHPEELEKMRIAQRQKGSRYWAQRYAERFQIIKPFIPAAGIRPYELNALVPQWSWDQIDSLLKRAVKCGNLIRVGVAYNRRYRIPV